jgi:hypothetical protein
MEIFITISVILLLYSIAITWGAWNTIKKNEQLESALEEIYGQVSVVLEMMKQIDEKQMFEKDDEVGSVFTQLIGVLYSLKIILGEDVDGIKETED